MNPRDYHRFRNALISLLNRAAETEGLEEADPAYFRRLAERAAADRFEIVLAGEFQSGKSTTFNALCDGRPLAPTGSGIRTSACLVSADPLSDLATDPAADLGEAEWAEIRWRSNAELVAGFSDLLLPHLQGVDPGRFGTVSAGELGEHLDLESAGDRALLQTAVEAEWELWQKDRAAYDPEGRGQLDVLRAATLTLRFADAPERQALRERNQFELAEARAMMAFPEDWESRWRPGEASLFAFEEVRFLFVAGIRLHVQSPRLGQIGAVLTDCPGLLASRWDTETARAAMLRADAVLYLFDGSKTPKMTDLSALRFIRNNGMAHKLLFGFNMRGHSLEASRRIREAGLTALENAGYQVEDSEAVLFHALLALRSVQAERFLAGELDPASLELPGELPGESSDESSAESAGNGSTAPASDSTAIAEALRRSVARQAAILEMDPPSALDADAAAAFRNASGIDALTGAAEARVVVRKARTVLLDNGARAALTRLTEAEGALTAREAAVLRKGKAVRDQIADVEAELRKFRMDASGIINRLDDSGADFALAEEGWSRIDAEREGLIRRTLARVHKEVLGRPGLALLARKKFEARIAAIVKEEVDAVFTDALTAWAAEVREGRSAVYQEQIGRRVRSVSRDLARLWERSGLSAHGLLTGAAAPNFSGELLLDAEAVSRELDTAGALEDVRYTALVAAGGISGIMTATSGVLAGVYMLLTRLLWVKIATAVAFLINLALMALTKGMMERHIRAEIENQLRPALERLFLDIRADVAEELRTFSARIRELYIDLFLTAMERPGRLFEVRRRRAEADLERSEEERTEVAETVRDLRQNRLRPLQIRFSAFRCAVEERLGIASEDCSEPADLDPAADMKDGVDSSDSATQPGAAPEATDSPEPDPDSAVST